MDSLNTRTKSQEVSEENTEIITSNGSEEVLQQKDHSIKKTFSTLKEENDKLRTYLGLVKMCNYSAINKIKLALNETIDSIHSANASDNCTIDSNIILKQLEIIQNEIMNMQSMHTKLEEGIEAFQLIDNTLSNCVTSAIDEVSDQNRLDQNVIVVTTRYDVPRKSTGIRKSFTNRNSNKLKSKTTKESSINSKLLNRIVDKTIKGVTTCLDGSQTTIVEVSSEEREAVANIDTMSSCEERENVSEVNTLNELNARTKITKRPYISEEFKSSHLQRLVEAKRRREEMNKQLEREGKRKAKIKRGDEHMREIADFGKKSPKKRQSKKKTVGKVTSKKKIQSQPVATTQSIVVPLSQSTLDSLSGQTIQIIASGGTQILCRNDGTFIPATNTTQWQTTNTQWTTADANTYTQTQWNQYQS